MKFLSQGSLTHNYKNKLHIPWSYSDRQSKKCSINMDFTGFELCWKYMGQCRYTQNKSRHFNVTFVFLNKQFDELHHLLQQIQPSNKQSGDQQYTLYFISIANLKHDWLWFCFKVIILPNLVSVLFPLPALTLFSSLGWLFLSFVFVCYLWYETNIQGLTVESSLASPSLVSSCME